MTKSRTLRKAGAVVLSLAMAASTLLIAPDASAATKVKLSATKATLAAGKSKSVTIKGLKKSNVKKLTVKTSKKSVATVKKVNNIKFKVTASSKLAKKATATITAKATLKKAVNKKKTYTLKFKATVKAAKTTTDDEGTTLIKDVVVLKSKAALQSDNTVLIGDEVELNIPASVGVVSTIQWLCDGNIQNASTTAYTGDLGFKTAKAGKWSARVVTAGGTTYETNEIVVTDKEAAATLSNVGVADVYDVEENGTQYISFAETDAKAVLSVTLNKDYAGTVKVYDAKAKKGDATVTGMSFTTSKKPATADIKTLAYYDGSDAAHKVAAGTSVIVSNESVSDKDVLKSTFAKGAFGFVNADGTVTYKFYADNLKRGTEYKVVFAQTAVDNTDIGLEKEISTTATAPYVTAPSSIKLTSVIANAKPAIEFDDAAGAALKWINAGAGFDSVKVYSSGVIFTDNTKAASNIDALTSGAWAKGVLTSDNAIAATQVAYNKAVATTHPGIFGKDAVTLESALTEEMGDAAAYTLSVAESTASTAKVTFTKLTDSGTVYIVRDVADGDAAKKAVADNNTDLIKGSKTVAKGDATVEIENAVTKMVDKTSNADGNDFYAVFVPDNKSLYVTQVSAKVELVAELRDITYASGKSAGVVLGAEAFDVVLSKDQFGETMKLDGTEAALGDYNGKGADSSDKNSQAVKITLSANTTTGDPDEGKLGIALTATAAATGGIYTFTIDLPKTTTKKVTKTLTVEVTGANAGKLTIA